MLRGCEWLSSGPVQTSKYLLVSLNRRDLKTLSSNDTNFSILYYSLVSTSHWSSWPLHNEVRLLHNLKTSKFLHNLIPRISEETLSFELMDFTVELSPKNDKDKDEVDWESPDDPQYPRNWMKRAKLTHVFLVSTFTLYSWAKSLNMVPFSILWTHSDWQGWQKPCCSYVFSRGARARQWVWHY